MTISLSLALFLRPRKRGSLNTYAAFLRCCLFKSGVTYVNEIEGRVYQARCTARRMCDVAAVPLCTEPREAAQRLPDRSTVSRRRHAAVFDELPLTQHQRVPVAFRLGALRRCSRLRAKETSLSKRKGKYNLQMCTAYLFFGCLRRAVRKENRIKRQCWKFLSTELVRHDSVPQESDVSIYGLHIQ